MMYYTEYYQAELHSIRVSCKDAFNTVLLVKKFTVLFWSSQTQVSAPLNS